ncbi:YkoF family thiamine/hydroxymethylpyrimidine-binding protein [Vulcanibacillus modesticaldus]|nr:YkoF family thiamine/hydroxymethylpyrimidine-binding protein [Vulcanibacillus modesticaldus]
MISCQVALYPLATKDFNRIIIEALENTSCI